jgi:hypothetical protein
MAAQKIATAEADAREARRRLEIYRGERFGRWQWPRRGDELFLVNVNKIMTRPERDKAADGPDQLTVDEIRKLVHAATDRQRMLILSRTVRGDGADRIAVVPARRV